MLRCDACGGKQVTKNGHIHNGKQRYRCKSCGRQFVYGATNKRISDETKQQVDKLLLEKLSLAGIAGVLNVSETWLQGYVNQKYANVEQRVQVKEKEGLVIECDELSSFVARKTNRQWVWLALDRSTREIVGCFVGARNESGAQGLWDSLPICYLDAECHTDLWAAYQTVVFGNKHHRYGKGTQH